MKSQPSSSSNHQVFVSRYPKLGQAWEFIADAGDDGPIDERTGRLLKLGIAVGALREEAIKSHVAKALSAGITREEVEQVVALAAGMISLQATAVAFSWVEEAMREGTSISGNVGGRPPGMRQSRPHPGPKAGILKEAPNPERPPEDGSAANPGDD